MSFVLSDFSLGRQRCRQWASLITQQLRLRHVDQIYAYNLLSEKKSSFYFTLHKTCMSSPFYTSEKIVGKHPKWFELMLKDVDGHISSVVIRIWKCMKDNDEIVTTWGVNFSGLVYLGSKIADLHPRYFKSNTVIFTMQGGYFTSQAYIKTDFDGTLPFHKYLNLVEKDNNESVLYRRIAIKAPESEIQTTYTLDKLRQLQDLQRLIKNKSVEVQNVVEKIRRATESEQKDTTDPCTSNDNVRFAPQLLTMNSLNKMLHGKPTKKEREKMVKITKQIEETKFRIKLLSQERDKRKAFMRSLKQKGSQLSKNNDEKNSNLISLYHSLSRDIEKLKEYKYNFIQNKELLIHTTKQIHLRQKQLFRELLFLYPIKKTPNENKYMMLEIYLPNSEILIDCSDLGISVVLGYICHILIMCSVFLQVPLRYPMKHFGSKSVIYDQVSASIPDKEREFPLYTKGKDKGHFGYAVFLLNKNISQLQWFFHHWYNQDLKETLKNLYDLLLGNERNEIAALPFHEEPSRRLHIDNSVKTSESKISSDDSGSTLVEDVNMERFKKGHVTLDKLVSLSSSSSSNINDPLLGGILEEIRSTEPPPVKSPARKLGIFKSTMKRSKKAVASKGSSEVLAVPEAYLNKQISKDLFDKCASGMYTLSRKHCNLGNSLHCLKNQCTDIKVKDGIEEFKANVDNGGSQNSDSIEQGTDPLDPLTSLDSIITKSITIRPELNSDQNVMFSLEHKRISRSAGSYIDEEVNGLLKTSLELGSDPLINVCCDKTVGSSSSTGDIPVSHRSFLEKWLKGESSLVLPSSMVSDEDLRVSLQDISCPLTARTDRLLSTNQSFNLVKHRNVE